MGSLRSILIDVFRSAGGYIDANGHGNLALLLSRNNRIRGISHSKLDVTLERLVHNGVLEVVTRTDNGKIRKAKLVARYHDGTGNKRTFAPKIGAATWDGKQLPAYLPDELCSEVTVRYKTDTSPAEVIEAKSVMTNGAEVANTPTPFSKLSPAQRMTIALQALQTVADGNGVFTNPPSASNVIWAASKQLGGSESTASSLLNRLTTLRLVRVKNLGHGTYQYWVNTQIRQITQEDLETQPSAEDQLLGLIQIVHSQEEALTILANERDTAVADREKLTAVNQQLAAEVETLKNQLNDLKEEVKKAETVSQATSRQATEILARYSRK
ncbi:MAG TPA: hypothetical protein VH144_01735 [Candidatus Saccharimonadales bacterium]|nr:hypothetical protein [Candidatus Saccharimonadales bacterium]